MEEFENPETEPEEPEVPETPEEPEPPAEPEEPEEPEEEPDVPPPRRTEFLELHDWQDTDFPKAEDWAGDNRRVDTFASETHTRFEETAQTIETLQTQIEDLQTQLDNADTSIAFEESPTNILMDGSASVGTLETAARADHRHPTDTTLIPFTGGSLTGNLVAQSNTSYSTQRVRNIAYSTSDLTAGSSSLSSGNIYLVYE